MSQQARRFRCPACCTIIEDHVIGSYYNSLIRSKRKRYDSRNVGRKPSIPHDPDNPRCSCLNCRKSRAPGLHLPKGTPVQVNGNRGIIVREVNRRTRQHEVRFHDGQVAYFYSRDLKWI